MITETTIQVSDTEGMTAAERRAARRNGTIQTVPATRYIIAGTVESVTQDGPRNIYVIDGAQAISYGPLMRSGLITVGGEQIASDHILIREGDDVEVMTALRNGIYQVEA